MSGEEYALTKLKAAVKINCTQQSAKPTKGIFIWWEENCFKTTILFSNPLIKNSLLKIFRALKNLTIKEEVVFS